MLSDYIPRGPSSSNKVKQFAEEKLLELRLLYNSNVDRKQFLNALNQINEE